METPSKIAESFLEMSAKVKEDHLVKSRDRHEDDEKIVKKIKIDEKITHE